MESVSSRDSSSSVGTIPFSKDLTRLEDFALNVGQSKAAFVIFCQTEAPGCQKVRRAWEALGSAFDSRSGKALVVGSVDCTRNLGMCSSHSVEKVPTMLGFSPGMVEGEVYLGGIDYKSLMKYAGLLADECDARAKDSCTTSAMFLLQSFFEMSVPQVQSRANIPPASTPFDALGRGPRTRPAHERPCPSWRVCRSSSARSSTCRI